MENQTSFQQPKKKKEKNLKNRRDSHILHNTYTCKMFKAVREVR